jgi:hypothetical protein
MMTKDNLVAQLQRIVDGAKRDDFHGQTIGALKRRRLVWMHPTTGNPIISPGGRKLLQSASSTIRQGK